MKHPLYELYKGYLEPASALQYIQYSLNFSKYEKNENELG